ncbi:hypothetical protein OROGR_013391 [Orobanche gracilis]
MVWCNNCAKHDSLPDDMDGRICCSLCGRVIDDDNFAQDPTFVKNAAGQSRFAGNYVKTTENEYSVSRQRTLDQALAGIESVIYALGIDGGDSISRPALAFYTIAVERSFTKGRRKEQVEAACLYIACREKKKPYLLIDFSEHLRINVYVLGAVFLELCKLLSLVEHPIVRKPVDPSLFIHRFTDRLFGGRKPGVSRTALQILASMKRDWMQTGRKPSALCGAALYISALSHGLKCSKSDIIKVVHVCEATLMKRLIEFENTESGSLTVPREILWWALMRKGSRRSILISSRKDMYEGASTSVRTSVGKTEVFPIQVGVHQDIEEFNMKAGELEKEERLITSHNTGSKASGNNELLCEHKGSGRPHFAHGLCDNCYEDFLQLSGGLNGGSEPPAFERAEMERIMAKEDAAKSSKNLDSSTLPVQAENRSNLVNSDGQRRINNTRAAEEHKIMNGSSKDRNHEADATFENSESLSDIDDDEVKSYVLDEEEKEFKKFIWEELNKEYVEEQAAKEAAAMDAKKAYEANLANCSGDVEAAQRLAAAAAEALAKSKKEKRQKRAEEIKNAGPAQTAHEATKQVLDRKRLSSKVNQDALEKLLSEYENPFDTKKRRIESASDHEDGPNNGEDGPEFEGDQVENVEDFNYDDFDYDCFFDDYSSI